MSYLAKHYCGAGIGFADVYYKYSFLEYNCILLYRFH